MPDQAVPPGEPAKRSRKPGQRVVTRKPSNPTATRAKSAGVTPRVQAAIDAMIFEGLPRSEAAQRAGMTEHGLYKAFRKPPVLKAWNEGLDVLRTSGRARNIHALEKIRDQDGNLNAAVSAVKELERGASMPGKAAGSVVTVPGVVIQINAERVPRVTTHDTRIELNALADQHNPADDSD